MKAQNKRYGKSLINFLLIAFRGLFFLGALSLIIWALICIISIFADVPTFKTSYPVTFSVTGEGSLLVPNDTEIPKFVMPYSQGNIVLEGLPKNAAILYSLGSAFLILCTLFILKYLCQILEAAYTGQFLIDKNAIRLRWIALLSIAVCVIESLRIFLSSLYLSDKLEFSGVHFHYGSPLRYVPFLIKWEYILASLFLLVIAEAFRIGAQLKQENDMTI